MKRLVFFFPCHLPQSRVNICQSYKIFFLFPLEHWSSFWITTIKSVVQNLMFPDEALWCITLPIQFAHGNFNSTDGNKFRQASFVLQSPSHIFLSGGPESYCVRRMVRISIFRKSGNVFWEIGNSCWSVCHNSYIYTNSSSLE